MIIEVPRAEAVAYQHCLETYASETNKLAATWLRFTVSDWDFRMHPKSSSVGEILKHQLLSERRFFAEFLALPEPPAAVILPEEQTPQAYAARAVELASYRLPQLAAWREGDWLKAGLFFDVQRERIWIFWRRVLHTAHHRTQLTLYLRSLNRDVPSIYGPSADETWAGADPTTSVEAAERP